MKTLVKAVLFCTIFISASLFVPSSCQKEQTVISEKRTMENPVIQEVESRSNVCNCPTTGCNGPAKLRIEVLERVHEPVINLYLYWLCGPINETSECKIWANPQIGDVLEAQIGYASGTGGQIPAGTFTPHYRLEALFYSPLAPSSKLTLRITGPGINQIVTFNTSLGTPPLVQSLDLYPWQWCL